MDWKEWCIEQHRKTNHFYDTYLPYEFHLRMVVQVALDFKHLLPTTSYYEGRGRLDSDESWMDVIGPACWGHDLIEDTRCSFNDVSNHIGQLSAEIVYAVTNEKGRNRAERGNDKYYEGIRNTKGATYVKLCDRIANVQYSKMTRSRMFEMYQKENEDFMKKVNADMYPEMKEYLINLFKN